MRPRLIIPESVDVAVICEGNTEKHLLTILLEADLLKFRKDQLLKDTLLGSRYRGGTSFRDEFLTMTFDNPITLIQIQDTNRKLLITPPYSDKIDKHFIIQTKPEIEILLVHHLNLFDEYNKVKSKDSPSTFLANHLKMNKAKVKSKVFIKEMWTADTLYEAIRTYSSKTKLKEFGLIDLLKEV